MPLLLLVDGSYVAKPPLLALRTSYVDWMLATMQAKKQTAPSGRRILNDEGCAVD